MKLRRITMAAMFAALIFILTYVVKIPLYNGYANIGDVCVLIVGLFLPPFYAFLASAIGSCLADIFSGYMIYAPVTFFVKGLMSLLAYFLFKTLKRKLKPFISMLLAFLIAELFMVASYYIFEGFMYGFIASVVNIPFNALQGIISIAISLPTFKLFEKIKKNSG